MGCRSLGGGGSLRPGPLTIFTCKTESRISAFKSKGLAVLDYEQGAMWGGEGRARERGKRGEEGQASLLGAKCPKYGPWKWRHLRSEAVSLTS